MTQIFYKERTPVSLNNILLSHPYFKEQWKTIPSVIRMLNHILRWNQADEGFSSITYHRFKNTLRDDYIIIIQSLEDVGLIRVIRSTWRKKSAVDCGHCYEYYLTPKCQRALADTNREYLYLLLTDKSTKRRNQKQISDRGHKVYGDVRDILKDGLDNITIDLAETEKVVATMPDGKAAFVWSLLISIIKKDYSNLSYNVKDGRIWTPYAQLPSEVRAIIKVKGLEYQRTIDIRSCYPSLWAEYICSLFPHIGCTKVDNERQKWNDLFLTPGLDPKTEIAKFLNIPRCDVKEVLIQYFNGKHSNKESSPFYKFNVWLEREFPLLYTDWKKTKIRQTGNNIGKYFETKLMLDKTIYERAKLLGIVIGYEYDGMSFYAKNDDNCDALLAFITQRSVELLGIKLIFVDKTTDILAYMSAGEADTLLKRVQEMDVNLSHLRGRCWSNSQTWKPYNDVRYKGTDAYWEYSRVWKPYYNLRATRDEMMGRLSQLRDSMET